MLPVVHGAFFGSFSERCATVKHFREKGGEGRKEVERAPAPSLSSHEMILKRLYSLSRRWS